MIASERNKLIWLIVLLVVGALAYLWNRNSVSGIPGVTVAAGFQPLNVQDPELRLDMLDKIRKLEYSGAHRNIFSATPLPPVITEAEKKAEERRKNMGPVQPPPPPPQIIYLPAPPSPPEPLEQLLTPRGILVIDLRDVRGNIFGGGVRRGLLLRGPAPRGL